MINPNEVPRITAGMTLAVDEKDYCYGTGMALLIVRSIAVDQRLLPSTEWVRIDCDRLRCDDGAGLGPFAPLVRTRALAAAVRQTGWLPRIDQRAGAAVTEQDGDQRPEQGHRRG